MMGARHLNYTERGRQYQLLPVGAKETLQVTVAAAGKGEEPTLRSDRRRVKGWLVVITYHATHANGVHDALNGRT